MNALNQRQRALRDALELAAPGEPAVQLGLIYIYAARVRASQRDVNVVQKLIAGGPVRECAG